MLTGGRFLFYHLPVAHDIVLEPLTVRVVPALRQKRSGLMLGELARQTVDIVGEIVGYDLALLVHWDVGIIDYGLTYGYDGVLLFDIDGIKAQALARSAMIQARYIDKPRLQTVDILGISLGRLCEDDQILAVVQSLDALLEGRGYLAVVIHGYIVLIFEEGREQLLDHFR